MTAGIKQTPEIRLALQRQGLDEALHQIAAQLEALASGEPLASSPLPEVSALTLLGRIFGLDAGDQYLLALAAGQELSPRIGTALAGLTGTGVIDTEFCARFFGAGAWDMLSPGAPLRRWRLIDSLGNGPLRQRPLRIDERVLHFLLGSSYLDPRLDGLLRVLPAANLPAEGAVVDLAERIVVAWAGAAHLPVLLLGGRDRVGKRVAVAEAAARLGVLALVLSCDDLAGREALATLLDRELALSGAVLLIEAGPDQGRAAARLADQITGPTLIAADDPLPPDRAPRLRLDLDPPAVPARAALWRQALGDNAKNADLSRLATQFALDAQGIAAAVAEAGVGEDFGSSLWQAARRQGRRALDGLAMRIDSRAVWADLVLPADQIETLKDLARHLGQQWRVNQDWGWAAKGARGLGTAVLFAGPSGTGKTLAAEVLAGELRLDLYRIDLSQVVSKYIGETEKNLARIFDAAEASGAILLFDEADALFGKRSEVKDSHDRYANVEVSYLLQKMEAYRGLAILTTNQKSALDPAFLRRLRHVVSFPFPDAEARTAIWQGIFPLETPREGIDPAALARLNLSGGSIRSVALNAAYLAAGEDQAVTMRHVQRAARREYAKLEKPFTAAEQGVFR